MRHYFRILALILTAITISKSYNFDLIEKDLQNNKISYHSKRLLQEDEGTPKPVWEPIRIKYVFEQPLLALGDSYMNRIIQTAVNFFEQHLLAKHLANPIVIDFDECLNVKIPTQMKNSTETSHQLIIVYVVSDESDYTFRCTPCAMMPGNIRPGVLFLTINQANLDTSLTERNFKLHTQILIQELLQGMAFLRPLLQYYQDVVTGKFYKDSKVSYFDSQFDLLSTPRLVELAKSHFDCENIDGIRLQSTIHQFKYYFSNNIFRGDILTNQEHYLISNFTFTLLMDTGFYQVGYVEPDHLPNGYKKGCDYYFKTCQGKEQYPEFCYTDTVSECSNNYQQITQCKSEYSGCDFKTNWFDCTESQVLENVEMTFGDGVRCFSGKFMDADLPDFSTQIQTSCGYQQCNANRTALQITLGKLSFICANDGEFLTAPYGFRGYLQCPQNITDFCSEQRFCEHACSFNGICMNRRCYCRSGYYGSYCQYICKGVTYNNRCYDRCPIGTFQHQQKFCLRCQNNCLSCSRNVGNCTECQDSQHMIANGICEVNTYKFGLIIMMNLIMLFLYLV